MKPEYYIGLMSGTSLDGIDAVLADFGGALPQLIASHHQPIPELLRDEILRLCQSGKDEINRMGILDRQLGRLFAQSIEALLNKSSLTAAQITAIGSHGQTLRHAPEQPDAPYTLQVGDPCTIAIATGITTVSDFRRADIAAGGQGAPLVPAFHAAIFQDNHISRTVVNIGGMANISILPVDNQQPIIGFDTGPGNVLIDTWIQLNKEKSYDNNGEWAAAGTCHHELLDHMLDEGYFRKSPPKSTGRERFSLEWIEQKLLRFNQLKPRDVHTTLTHLTANSITQAVNKWAPDTKELIVCGGGAFNQYLMSLLEEHEGKPAGWKVSTTQSLGLDPEWIEAFAFAWLAKQRMENRPSNCPSVTGARLPVTLGAVYQPAKSSISE